MHRALAAVLGVAVVLAGAACKPRSQSLAPDLLADQRLGGGLAWATGEIPMLMGQRVSQASIAQILEVAPSTLHSFIQSRRLEPKNRRQT